MIEYFKFKNYRSFKDETILDMTPVNKLKEDEYLDKNVYTLDSPYVNLKESNNKLLKIAAINGQNASGKSNLIKALYFMQSRIIQRISNGSELVPYMYLDEEETSEFELSFVVDNIKFRYGFKLNKKEILNEWLYLSEKGREKKYFERKGNKLELSNKESIDSNFINMAEKTLKEKKDSLALSILYFTFGVTGLNEELKKVGNYFKINLVIIPSDINEENGKRVLFTLLENMGGMFLFELIKKYIMAMDTRIIDIEFKQNNLNKEMEIYTIHRFRKISGEIIERRLPLIEESSGTQKLFYTSIFILVSLINNNAVLLIDELDNSIHTNLFLEIIKLFQKSKSQFIFATHNPYIMEHSLLRRDQIYFVDKNENEESELYSLSDFQGVKTTDSYQKRYLNGNYGAVPIIDFLELEKILFDLDKKDIRVDK